MTENMNLNDYVKTLKSTSRRASRSPEHNSPFCERCKCNNNTQAGCIESVNANA